MKKYINLFFCKTNWIFLVTILVVGSINAQLQYADQEVQRANLESAMSDYLLAFGISSITVATMQIPNTNTFIIATNGSNLGSDESIVRDYQISLSMFTNNGFSEVWSDMNMEFIYVTRSSSSDVAFMDYYSDSGHPNGGYNTISLPSRTRVNLHAEMAVLAATDAYYYNRNLNSGVTGAISSSDSILYNSIYFVIQSSREFCPRCYGYLSLNGMHVPELNISTVQGDDFNSTVSWSPPNYNITTLQNDLQGQWPAIFRTWSGVYMSGFNSVTTYSGTTLSSMGLAPFPINRGTTQLY